MARLLGDECSAKAKVKLTKNALERLPTNIYNKDGIFPITLLLTSDGKVLKEWKGFPRISSDEFTSQLKAAVDANN